jgi:hypothetical protein
MSKILKGIKLTESPSEYRDNLALATGKAVRDTNEIQKYAIIDGTGRFIDGPYDSWLEADAKLKGLSKKYAQVKIVPISGKNLEEDLHKWFKEKWVRFGPDGKIRGDCARGDDSEGKPKCLPQAKAHSLGKKGRKYAASKKRREDPNPERSGPAKNVATKKKSNESVVEEQLDELKCWPGYSRVQGVPAGAPGSCKKKTNESSEDAVQIKFWQQDTQESGQWTKTKPMSRATAEKVIHSFPRGEIVDTDQDVAEGSEQEELVSQFLKSISPKELRYYSIRDNCGPAALHMRNWAEKQGIDLKRHGGYFVADNVVYDKLDFTKEMKQDFLKQGLDFNDPTARKEFIESNPEYSEEWKKVPHYWLQDNQGNIYDPTGYIQFIKTGLSSDLDSRRYLSKKGVTEGSTGVSVKKWAAQVRQEHGADTKFTNDKVHNRIIARKDKEIVGSYDRKANNGTVFSPEQDAEFNGDLDSKGRFTKDTVQKMFDKLSPDAKDIKEEKCPHCAGPMFSEALMMEKKDACYYKVKSRYKVWPSAYASGALVKCRNKGAKNWGNKSESAIMRGLQSESLGTQYPSTYEEENEPFKRKGQRRIGTLTTEEKLSEKWSDKYKRSIDCSNPKGFSQRAHCQGKKKKS